MAPATILALDTSTEACTVALVCNGQMRERFEIAPRGHGVLVLGMIEQLRAEAGIALSQIDMIAYGRGPGGFTGVRVATGVVQGLAFALDIPVVPVSTLAALAQGVFRDTAITHVLTAVDARMSEIYWAAYRRDAEDYAVLCGTETVIAPERAPLPEEGSWYGAGTGWGSYCALLEPRLAERYLGYDGARLPHARDVATLGARGWSQGLAVPAEQALPTYLRNEVAWRQVTG